MDAWTLRIKHPPKMVTKFRKDPSFVFLKIFANIRKAGCSAAFLEILDFRDLHLTIGQYRKDGYLEILDF